MGLFSGDYTLDVGWIYCYQWEEKNKNRPRNCEIKWQDVHQEIIQKHNICYLTGITSPGSPLLSLFLWGTLATWQAVGVWCLVLFDKSDKRNAIMAKLKTRITHIFPPSLPLSPFPPCHSTFLSLNEGLLVATFSQDPMRTGSVDSWVRSLPSTLAKVQLW